MLQAALDYTDRFAVVILWPRSKRPVETLAVNGWQSATRDPAVVRSWWSRYPDGNVGIALVPSGIAALDIDPRHGGDDSLHDLERALGELPETWRALTGGGGLHIYLRDPGVPLVGNLAPGVEVKRRHLLVAPPSATERPYEWEVEPGEVDLADVPEPWLERIVAETREAPPNRIDAGDDPLKAITPAVYIEALTGQRPDRRGYVRCPFYGGDHDETPSLKVYAETGWCCYCARCQRTGGTVYEFAARLWGYPLPLRGPAFLTVEARLLDLLLEFFERRAA